MISVYSPPLQYVPGRWMQFVDGENLTIRTQKLLESQKIRLAECGQFKRDCYIIPARLATGEVNQIFGLQPRQVEPIPVRSFYYTSLVGDDPALFSVRSQIRQFGYEPHIFKKPSRDAKAKGVDIELTKDMLSHGFRGNYDQVVLVSGDGDYVPLVEEVKRLGKIVHVRFIEACTNPELKLAADSFGDISELLLKFASEKSSEQQAQPAPSGG